MAIDWLWPNTQDNKRHAAQKGTITPLKAFLCSNNSPILTKDNRYCLTTWTFWLWSLLHSSYMVHTWCSHLHVRLDDRKNPTIEGTQEILLAHPCFHQIATGTSSQERRRRWKEVQKSLAHGLVDLKEFNVNKCTHIKWRVQKNFKTMNLQSIGL